MNADLETSIATGSRPEPGEAVVEAAGLTKVFSDFWMRAKARAVDGIDFEIRRHEIFGLLGERIEEHDHQDDPRPAAQELGSTQCLRSRTVRRGDQGTDRLPARGVVPLPVPRRPRDARLLRSDLRPRSADALERIDELLDMVGLSQVKRRSVGEFSKNAGRRLGLAQAAINDPELLILDEPTSGLDPIETRQVKDLLLELGRRGTTILLSSHLLADVEDVCDRMVILYGGKIRAEGAPASASTRTGR